MFNWFTKRIVKKKPRIFTDYHRFLSLIRAIGGHLLEKTFCNLPKNANKAPAELVEAKAAHFIAV